MRRETKRLVVGPKEDAVLRALHRYHYLTSQQIGRLLRYSPRSIEHVRGILTGLYKAGFVERTVMPSRSRNAAGEYVRGGMAAYVYNLSRKAMHYLADDELDLPGRARPYAEREHKYLFLAHTLEVADILIAAELLSGQVPAIQVAQLLHERDLRRAPTKVRLSGPNQAPTEVTYTPDGYVDFHIYGPAPYRSCLGLEIDRGTEIQGKWRRKVQAILAYQRGPYQEAFGTDALTVCVIATPGESRLKSLVQWTEAELTELGRQKSSDLFRFTSLRLGVHVPEAEQATPADIFLAPRWRAPFASSAVPLLDEFE
jgi:hypothetical protein